jgi:uncharacterized OsmC-like protein
MAGRNQIKTLFERNREALTLRPAIGQGTAVTRVRVVEGMTCQVEEGDWKLTVDLGEKSGGNNRGPNPGVLGRAALGACLAQSYTMWAAYCGVPLDVVGIEIQADYDASGHYGIGDVTPGYSEVRYVVTVESEASEVEIAELLDEVDTHTPYLAVFGEPQPLRRELRVHARRG